MMVHGTKHRQTAILMLTAMALWGASSLLSPQAWAHLSRQDLATILYSNRFMFDRDGTPIVNIGLAHGADQVSFTSNGGLTFMPEGEGGPEIDVPTNRTWTVRVSNSRPGVVRWWVAVERVEPIDPAQVAGAEAVWRSRGMQVKSFPLGAVFGLGGQVFDSRHVQVAIGGTNDRAQAEELAQKMEKTYEIPTFLIDELESFPDGTIVLADQGRSNLVFRSRRLFWVIPQSHNQIRLNPIDGQDGPNPGGTYRGAIYFVVGKDGKLVVGNSVNAEEMLRGLVPVEIFGSSPDAALQAQAVAARGEVLAKIGSRHLADPYSLCATTHCQVYRGSGPETARTSAAVEATHGQVLFLNDQLVDTRYSSSCGGHGANNETIWPMPPLTALRGRLDVSPPPTPSTPSTAPSPEQHLGDEEALRAWLARPDETAYCRRSTMGQETFRWTVRRSAARMDSLMEAAGHQVGQVQAVTVEERGPSGRAMAVRIDGTLGSVVVKREWPIRQLFGRLRSGLFVVDTDGRSGGRPGSWVFSGAGFGHGVGMCQVGAVGRAQAGQDVAAILRHYYNGAELKKVY